MAANLISVARLEPWRDWRLTESVHTNHELIVVCRGRIHVEIEGEALVGVAGDILFYRAGCRHTEWNDEESPFVTYGLAFECESMDPGLPSRVTDAAGRVRQLAGWLAEEAGWPDLQMSVTVQAFLDALLAEWQRLAFSREKALVDGTRRYVRGRLAERIRLDDLAGASGLSKYHFLRLYKDMAGITPMQDVTRMRLEHARHLILASDLPLKTIAPMSGLGDQYHLCRLFKRHFGLRPGDVRRGVRAHKSIP